MVADLSVYLVTDAGLCGPRGVVETVRAAVDGGATVVQLRDKQATDAGTADLLVELSEVIDGRALLLVNDRLDAAVTARHHGARVDGIHLGQDDTSVERARELLGPDALIGLTANSREHLDALRALPDGTVDYVGVGVIRPTNTKPDHPPALGVAGFRALAAQSPVPAVAIGGIRSRMSMRYATRAPREWPSYRPSARQPIHARPRRRSVAPGEAPGRHVC